MIKSLPLHRAPEDLYLVLVRTGHHLAPSQLSGVPVHRMFGAARGGPTEMAPHRAHRSARMAPVSSPSNRERFCTCSLVHSTRLNRNYQRGIDSHEPLRTQRLMRIYTSCQASSGLITYTWNSFSACCWTRPRRAYTPRYCSRHTRAGSDAGR